MPRIDDESQSNRRRRRGGRLDGNRKRVVPGLARRHAVHAEGKATAPTSNGDIDPVNGERRRSRLRVDRELGTQRRRFDRDDRLLPLNDDDLLRRRAELLAERITPALNEVITVFLAEVQRASVTFSPRAPPQTCRG